MLTLIAESKTMSDHELPVTESQFEKSKPAGESVADEVMRLISGKSVGEIAERIRISARLASKVLRMAYEFSNKSLGITAIEAYTGVVFRALDYRSLSMTEKERLTDRVNIISSLYGWLNTDDIIKPYRTDFTTRLAPGDTTFQTYWRKDVTIALLKRLQATGMTNVLDLLPADAAKCVDRKLVKRFAKVWKVDFKEMKEGGVMRTPPAGRLKELRGNLLREIITRDITTTQQLIRLEADDFMPLGTPDYPDHIAFCV